MARTSRVKKNTAGTAYYHIMSRTNDKRFLFEKGRIKSSLVDALKRSAAFSGIELKAYAGMDNHFHVVCKVVRTDEPISESELLRRVAILKGENAAEKLATHWQELRSMGLSAMVDTAQDRLRGRTEAAYDAGARTILSWSFHAGESNNYASANPQKSWNMTVEGMKRVKSRERDRIWEENRKKYFKG